MVGFTGMFVSATSTKEGSMKARLRRPFLFLRPFLCLLKFCLYIEAANSDIHILSTRTRNLMTELHGSGLRDGRTDVPVSGVHR